MSWHVIMKCRVALCRIASCDVISSLLVALVICFVLARHAASCPVTSRRVLWCHVIASCRIPWRRATSDFLRTRNASLRFARLTLIPRTLTTRSSRAASLQPQLSSFRRRTRLSVQFHMVGLSGPTLCCQGRFGAHLRCF